MSNKPNKFVSTQIITNCTQPTTKGEGEEKAGYPPGKLTPQVLQNRIKTPCRRIKIHRPTTKKKKKTMRIDNQEHKRLNIIDPNKKVIVIQQLHPLTNPNPRY